MLGSAGTASHMRVQTSSGRLTEEAAGRPTETRTDNQSGSIIDRPMSAGGRTSIWIDRLGTRRGAKERNAIWSEGPTCLAVSPSSQPAASPLRGRLRWCDVGICERRPTRGARQFDRAHCVYAILTCIPTRTRHRPRVWMDVRGGGGGAAGGPCYRSAHSFARRDAVVCGGGGRAGSAQSQPIQRDARTRRSMFTETRRLIRSRGHAALDRSID